MNKEKTLSDRMKEYESVTDHTLMKRTPLILRLDGVAFHTFTKGFSKPYDLTIAMMMRYVADNLRKIISNVVFIYSQSDEISLLIKDWGNINTDCWFDNRLQKLCSVSASYATAFANEYLYNMITDVELKNMLSDDIDFLKTKVNKVHFDCRALNIPENDVKNYFIWRQDDAIRNSKQGFAQGVFKQKELMNKNVEEQIEMVKNKTGVDYYNLPDWVRKGFCICKSKTGLITQDYCIPIFKETNEYIEKFL